MRITKCGGNVFLDLGFAPAEAKNLRIRSEMMNALTSHIEAHKLTQARAAKMMRVTQPRISGLMRGKIGRFSIDTLVNMLTGAGLDVSMHIKAARSKSRTGKAA
jgi:predicted XRE-type DNA-binding protein